MTSQWNTIRMVTTLSSTGNEVAGGLPKVWGHLSALPQEKSQHTLGGYCTWACSCKYADPGLRSIMYFCWLYTLTCTRDLATDLRLRPLTWHWSLHMQTSLGLIAYFLCSMKDLMEPSLTLGEQQKVTTKRQGRVKTSQPKQKVFHSDASHLTSVPIPWQLPCN